MERDCVFCQKTFKVAARRNWQHVKFCSDECRNGLAAAAKRAEYTPKPLQRKDCAHCERSFLPARGGAGRQLYCSRNCFLKKRAKAAHELWSDKAREKACENCGSVFVPKKFGAGKQIYCSLSCQTTAINARRPAYRRPSLRRLAEFKLMRRAVLERDKVCVICSSGKSVHVHHWDNSGQTSKCDNSLDNLAVLCGRCHREIHSVTLVKVNGQWAVNGTIFNRINLDTPLPIHR